MTIKAKKAAAKKTGKMLRELRESRGIQAKFVASQMRISPTLLCDLEAGRRYWNVKRISEYREAIGLPINTGGE